MRRRKSWMLNLLAGVLLAGCSGDGSSQPAGDEESRLLRFSDCPQLRQYLTEIDAARGALTAAAGDAALPGAPAAGVEAPAGTGAPEREFSSTNIQEAGVDEPDLVKTDGEFIYLATGGFFLVIDAWPPEQTAEIARLQIEGAPLSLLVHGNRAVVFSQLASVDFADPAFIPGAGLLLKATVLDLTDRAAPGLLRETYFEGSFVDARMVDGRVHIVLRGAVDLAAVDTGTSPPSGGAPGVPAPAQAADPLFPRFFDRLQGGVATDAICACENVFRPTVPAGFGLLVLTTLDLNAPLGPLQSVSILGDEGVVYGSLDSLYVAAPAGDLWMWWPVVFTDAEQPRQTTTVHRFALGAEPAYVGSGEVAGRVLNRFALSEHQGVLRLAATEERWWAGEGPRNRLFLLRQEGDRLVELSRLEGLGKPGERLFAVRFDGARGFAVTFLQIDPLITLDLSDPAAPKVAGELEVPGVSTYLHPAGEGRLLAVGRNAAGGVDLSLFDVGNFAAPALVDRFSFAGSYSEAEYDHHAFSFFPRQGILAIPITSWGVSPSPGAPQGMDVFAGLHLFQVDPASGFTPLGTVDHAAFYRDPASPSWYTPEAVRRSFFIGQAGTGDFLYSVSSRGLKVNPFTSFQTDLAAFPLPAPPDPWVIPLPLALPAAR